MHNSTFWVRSGLVAATVGVLLTGTVTPASAAVSARRGAAVATPGWHLINADGSVGPALATTAPASSSGAAPATLKPGGCPAGTTNYSGAQAKFSCRNVFNDSKGYPVGLRVGVPTSYPHVTNDGNYPIIKGFGLQHAQVDHNIGPHSIALIVADAPPQPNKESSYSNRYLYQIGEIQAPGNLVETLNVVVQKGPDTTGAAPDQYDFGVITAYCSVGEPGDLPGYCPDDLPAPFNGGSSN
jgi:hypothetical protein